LSRARRLVAVLFALPLIAGVIAVGAAPAAADPGWAVAYSPSPLGATNGYLFGVSCPTSTSCLAVGGSNSANAQRWDGSHWSNLTVPVPASSNSILTSVFCPSSSSCYAVGSYSPASAVKTLVEHWDGTSWSMMTSAAIPGSSYDLLTSVWCRSDTDCYAVGEQASGPEHATLIEHWDGTDWTVIVSPNPGDATASFLTGVRCVLATMCVAVGHYETGSATKTLAEHWDGTTWTIMPTPNKSGVTETVLSDLACPNTTTCFAAGYSGPSTNRQTVIERWNGTAWSIVATPTFAGVQNHLSGVKCFSTTNCFAVGANGDNSLIERWNGTSWSRVPSPNSPAGGSELNAISCVTMSNCEAVGDVLQSTVVAEHWNGTNWTVDANARGGSQALLFDVTCPSATSCIAVGYYSNNDFTRTLAERWDGTSWSIMSTPNPAAGSRIATLADVSCATATNCFAVGSFETATFVDKTLVEHWDGTSWSIVGSPNQSGADATGLSAVSCASTTRCEAVGSSTSGATNSPFTVHWNGTTWSVAPNTPPAGSSSLTGVSCPSATSCDAVGSASGVGGPRTLVEHWNGTNWTVVTSPDPSGTTFSFLDDVACTAANSCDAVGAYSTAPGGANLFTLVEHWDGTNWTIVSSPNPSGRPELHGIACPSSSACYSVGQNDTGSVQAFAEQSDGVTWSLDPMPHPAVAVSSFLYGVACATTTTCFAVGGTTTSIGQYTLIEKHT
jgi:hypothetical protein